VANYRKNENDDAVFASTRVKRCDLRPDWKDNPRDYEEMQE